MPSATTLFRQADALADRLFAPSPASTELVIRQAEKRRRRLYLQAKLRLMRRWNGTASEWRPSTTLRPYAESDFAEVQAELDGLRGPK